MKPFRLRSSKDRKPLSEGQKRERAGSVVYPLMFSLCLGSFYLTFSFSGQERGRQDRGRGFSTGVPSPEDSRLKGSKKDAYEEALMEQKSRRRKAPFEVAESMFAKEKRKGSARLPDNIISERQTSVETETEKGNTGLVSTSARTYHEVSRTLGSIYEPRIDREKKGLLERAGELERMQQQKQGPLSGMEEKIALTEKSHKLAAKYNNRQAMETPFPIRKAEGKKAIPVRRVHNEVVPSLSRSMNDEESVSAFSGEHNTGLSTAVGQKTVTEGNTTTACIYGTQIISDGQALRLWLAKSMSVIGRSISKGTVLVDGTRIQDEHLEIIVSAVEYKGTILPMELEVYNLDGQQGVLVPGSPGYDATKEIAANMETSMDGSINIFADAGAQIASDPGKGVIQGVSQYIFRRMRTVKITSKAEHRVLFHSPEK